jgi:hypothetical protein
MKRDLRRTRNHRKNLDRYYDRKFASHDYANRGEKRKTIENFNGRRIDRRRNISNKNINLFSIKAGISFICLISIFAAVNFNIGFTDDIKENIKSALSENISYEKVESVIVRAFNKNDEESQYSNEYSDFRIDENIIEQMNNETDVYYDNFYGK